MQNNYDDLFDSINIAQAAKLTDCIGDIHMNENERVNLRDSVLKKAERYGIKPQPIENNTKRGFKMDNDINNKNSSGNINNPDTNEESGSLINLDSDNSSSSTSFGGILKIACALIIVAVISSVITIKIMNYKSDNKIPATAPSETAEPSVTKPSDTSTVAPTLDSAITPTTAATIAPTPGTTDTPTTSTPDIDINKIKISTQIEPDSKNESNIIMTITATYDNETLWQYTTASTGLTELDTIEQFGECNGLVYVNDANSITALDKVTGSVVWNNHDFEGAGVASAFDKDGTLYIVGYYKSDIVTIDKQGKTLWSTEVWDLDGYAIELHASNDVLTLTVEEETTNTDYMFNIKDGKAIK